MLPIEVLANPDCAHCRQALDEVTDAAVRAGVPVAGVDLRQHPELALRSGLEHSPIYRVGRHVHTGNVDANLLRLLVNEARNA